MKNDGHMSGWVECQIQQPNVCGPEALNGRLSPRAPLCPGLPPTHCFPGMGTHRQRAGPRRDPRLRSPQFGESAHGAGWLEQGMTGTFLMTFFPREAERFRVMS